MKTTKCFIGILTVSLIFFFTLACTQKETKDTGNEKIENTLISVSFVLDSIRTEPSVFLSKLELFNKAIDSIGFPDAGYKLWIIQNDSGEDFRYLVEGYWPNQAIYDSIHNHPLYKELDESQSDFWKGMKFFVYSRFTVVK